MSRCEELKRTCRECERSFEPHERMIHCPECGASRKCENPPVKGEKVCAAHGGSVPSRGFHGKTNIQKTGKYSKFRIVRLAAKYNEVETDAVLSSMRPLETILAGRLMELLERVDMGDAPERVSSLYLAWGEFKRTHPKIEDHYRSDGAKKARAQIDKLFEVIYHDYAGWKQILEIIDEKRKLSETKLKHLKEMRALIPAPDAYEMVAKLLAGIMKVVDDPNTLRAIQYEFAKITGEHNIGEPPDGGGEIIDIDARTMDRGEFLHPRDFTGSDSPGQDTSDTIPERLPE